VAGSSSRRSAATAGTGPRSRRVAAARAPGRPSPRRVLAAQVVAWHNRHPLARRISRRDLRGYGVVALPFSPDAGPQAPARFPMFDDLSLVPGLLRQKVVALAEAHGWDKRPGAPEWPLRAVPVAKGWDAKQSQPVFLLTAALRRGRRSPVRVLVGRGREAVLGRRVLSWPRVVLAGLAGLAPVGLLGWALMAWLPGPGAPRGDVPTPQAQVAPGAPPNPLGRVVRPAPPTAAGLPPGPSADPRSGNPADPGPAVHAPPSAVPGFAAGELRALPANADPRTAAAPTMYRLQSAPYRDPSQLKAQTLLIQSVVAVLGPSASGLRTDVAGSSEGDVLTVGPFMQRTEAERVARRLAARGVTMAVSPP
jgi:hypothetical protein